MAESAFIADPDNLIQVMLANGGVRCRCRLPAVFLFGGNNMRRICVLFLLLMTVMTMGSDLLVYVYDSLLPLAKESIHLFEEKYEVTVEVRSYGDAGSMLSKVISEGESSDADIVIGIDNLLSKRALSADIFLPYKPDGAERIIDKSLIFDESWRLVPYDFGSLAIVYNPAELEDIELNELMDLTAPEFKRSLLIQDPRTSSTGLAFLVWSYSAYGEEFDDFWRKLKPSILTVTMSWDDAFEKFEAGEAPMMVSYATDGAYSYEYYGTTTYGAIIPGGSGYGQIEGAGILKWTDKPELARKFMEFLLSPEFQSRIPLNQWMFPVIDVPLPESFDHAVEPVHLMTVDPALDLDKLIERWVNLLHE